MSNAQFRMDHVLRNAHELCAMAAGMGVVVTIERKAKTPLAMGHSGYVVSVREARQPAASGLIASESNLKQPGG